MRDSRTTSSSVLSSTRRYSSGWRSRRSASSSSPRIAVSGERSSWLASAVKRRWASNAPWSRPSMAFSTSTSRRYSRTSA